MGFGAKLAPALCSMLLVDRQNAEVTGACQPAVIEDRVQVSNRLTLPVAPHHDPVQKIWAGKVKQRRVNCEASMVEQRVGLGAKQFKDPLALSG